MYNNTGSNAGRAAPCVSEVTWKSHPANFPLTFYVGHTDDLEQKFRTSLACMPVVHALLNGKRSAILYSFKIVYVFT